MQEFTIQHEFGILGEGQADKICAALATLPHLTSVKISGDDSPAAGLSLNYPESISLCSNLRSALPTLPPCLAQVAQKMHCEHCGDGSSVLKQHSPGHLFYRSN
jgi:hypothetical protein